MSAMELKIRIKIDENLGETFGKIIKNDIDGITLPHETKKALQEFFDRTEVVFTSKGVLTWRIKK